jgi:transcriptional regulator with XRE-family HTH domain
MSKSHLVVSAPDALRHWRRNRAYTQLELGALIGVASTVISDFELGRRRPGLEVAFRIEDATGIDARAWIGGSSCG